MNVAITKNQNRAVCEKSHDYEVSFFYPHRNVLPLFDIEYSSKKKGYVVSHNGVEVFVCKGLKKPPFHTIKKYYTSLVKENYTIEYKGINYMIPFNAFSLRNLAEFTNYVL